MTVLLCVNKRTLGAFCEQTKGMNYTKQERNRYDT